jgi:hypothetical protein
VILHEEAEDGNAMPDLERPVMAVSRAVTNLVKVMEHFQSICLTCRGHYYVSGNMFAGILTALKAVIV